MFDIGFWEFALIGIITLIIVGPERMPSIARKTGTYIGKAKHFISKIQDDISEELESSNIKEHLEVMDKDDKSIREMLNNTKSTLNNFENDIDKQNK